MRRFGVSLICLILLALSVGAEQYVYLPLSRETAVALRKGWDKELFGPLGYKVQVVDVSTAKVSGASVALLDRGDLNFTESMAYMATDYKLNGYNTKVVWTAQPTIRKSVITFVLADSPYKTANDLVGKTIGTIRYCCGYAAALEIFQHDGHPIDTDLKKGDLRVWIAPGSPAIQQALLAGRIDVAADHLQAPAHTNPFLQGTYRILDSLPENSIYQRFGGRRYVYGKASWVDAHPKLAQAYAKLLDKSVNWVLANRDEAARIYAQDLRQPIGVANFVVASPEWASIAPSEQSWEKTVESLKEVQKQYKNLGEPLYLKKTLDDKELEQFVDKRFFKGGEYSAFN